MQIPQGKYIPGGNKLNIKPKPKTIVKKWKLATY